MSTVAGFHEEWFPKESQQVLAALARSVADVPGEIIEVGSWEGRSTIALANAVCPRKVHAVDTWAGSPGEVSSDLASRRDVFAQFCSNIVQWTKGNVVTHRMGWREYAAGFTGPVALLFIDAEHTYREVFDNVTAFLPYCRPGSVVCGDDAHHPPIRQALDDLFGPGEWSQEATVWSWRAP